MKRYFNQDYPATNALVAVTSLIFILMLIFRGLDYENPQTLYDFGAIYGKAIQYYPNQLWRLFSAMFVHIGLEHFLVNTVTIYFLGRQAEAIFGSLRFLALYLMSGVMGNIFVLFFSSPDTVSAGASTAIFGVFTSIIVLRFVVRNPYIQQLGQSYLMLLILNLIMSFLPGVSLAGHLGGLVGGGLCAVIFPVSGEKDAFRSGQRLLALLLYLLLALVLIVLSLNR